LVFSIVCLALFWSFQKSGAEASFSSEASIFSRFATSKITSHFIHPHVEFSKPYFKIFKHVFLPLHNRDPDTTLANYPFRLKPII